MGRLLAVHRYGFRKGGAEAVHLDHLRLFRSRGWTCAEFTMVHPKNEPSEWDGYFPHHYQPSQGWRGLAGVPRFIYSREAKRNMRRLLHDFRPDVIHIHGLYQQLTPSVLEPAVQLGIPIVYTVHDFKLLCPAYMFYSETLGTCERCADGHAWNCAVHRCMHRSVAVSAVYAADALYHRWRGSYEAVSAYVMPSRSILEKHQAHGFPSDKLHHIPNFFETTVDEATDASALARMRNRYGTYVLYFGRLSPEKGCAHLIAACAAAGLPLVMVGEGPEEERLRAIARRSATTVVFTGYLTGRELWAFVEAALCVALPSLWYEIAPKSVLEAMARGKPVVASAIGGLPELIEHGQSGFLVPPGDAKALAEALGRLAALPDGERAAMGAKARHRALTGFSADRYYSSMVRLYADLLGRPLHPSTGLSTLPMDMAPQA